MSRQEKFEKIINKLGKGKFTYGCCQAVVHISYFDKQLFEVLFEDISDHPSSAYWVTGRTIEADKYNDLISKDEEKYNLEVRKNLIALYYAISEDML